MGWECVPGVCLMTMCVMAICVQVLWCMMAQWRVCHGSLLLLHFAATACMVRHVAMGVVHGDGRTVQCSSCVMSGVNGEAAKEVRTRVTHCHIIELGIDIVKKPCSSPPGSHHDQPAKNAVMALQG